MLTIGAHPTRNTRGEGLGGGSHLSKKRTERRKEISLKSSDRLGARSSPGTGVWLERDAQVATWSDSSKPKGLQWPGQPPSLCAQGGPRTEGPRRPALDPEVPSHSP